MGEHEGCVEPGRPLPNGLLPGAGLVMQALDTDRWLKAEERTAELIACIQPNQLSEERRNAVADYVQRLIMKCIPCQVCTFGSVPLKTYLPDGDIDLTAFTHSANLKDTCANQVRDMLENEERNENAEFHVKEVQYIQAEVKIIKCLVENIVVDISFNQVGGLCTLCFLDEVDNLINQNHLFKRSIILIKAWCYYESRILGAHHGLISTYALETLVLYIFHVFNNSFHGPLEVLYRFLEFFSNFDWNNFCVSLWGPVPISSLPDVTAQPPRKDSGELLLSKLFLDACSSVYAVFPGGQENNGQSFVSKHFNVIDPLRVNNNLGRSVSKGNFFRIRSAFAFGAKRLARLLDCPRENLVFEVNQFFLNTWERHGSGHRPDVREIDSRLSPTDSSHEFENSKDNISWKKGNENASVHGMEGGGINAHVVSSQHSKHSHVTVPRTNELSAASRTHTLKSQFNLKSLRDTNRIGREHASNQVVSNDKIQTDKKADDLGNDIRRRSLFARTSSSPELTDAYGDMSSQVKHSRQMDISHSNANSARMDSGKKRNNFRCENLASHNSKSSVEDTSSIRHAPLHQTLDAADDSHSSFNSCQRDLGLYSLSEDLSSISGAQEMNPEEQDIINMMASTSLQGRNEQVHFPFNSTSSHLPFQIPPSFLASMGYSQRNLPGYLPSSIPLIDPSFSNVPFPHGFVSPQLTHYFPGIGLSSLTEDVDAINDNFGSPKELNPVEVDNDFWQERDVKSSGDHPENGNFELFHSGDKSPVTMSGLKYVPPFRASGSGSATKVQHRHAREKGGSGKENSDNFPMKNSDFYAEERSASSRFSSATQSNSLRSRTSSESSWDGSPVKTSKSAKEKRGKKIYSVDAITGQGKGKMSERVAYQAEDDEQEWGSSSQAETEMAERDLGPEPLASQLPRHHMPGPEIAQTSGSDSMIPPVLLGPGPRHGMNDNSGMVAFFPTGPPIPFLTMLRVYDAPPETGTSEASNGNFGVDETLDISEFGQKFSSEGFGSSEELNSSSSLRGTTTNETSEEHKSDILNSDFASHWQNLQFGRFCENARYHGPLAYSSPVMVPPGYLQGRFPDDNPNRPLVANTNLVSQLVANYGHCLVPVTPPSVSSVPPNMYQHYVDDMPRHRSGTGTYLPNPKVSTRERQFSGTRRGSYNHDRNDNYSDREGNWNAYSKSRATAAAARNHNRSQIDRSNLRSDRLNTSESQTDRSWNSYRHDSIPFYQSQNGPFRSNPSQNSFQNVAYSMYPFAAAHPNGVSNGPSVPPVMMLYPFDHNMTYGSHGEQLEFGTLGPAGFPGINEQSQLNESIPARTFEDHINHGGSEHRSSPDEPSSPHYQR